MRDTKKARAVVYAHKQGFRVTKDGKLISPTGYRRKTRFISRMYEETTIRVGEEQVRLSIHQLQAYQKFGKKALAEGTTVRHLNGRKRDNSWDNIGIGTISDNFADMPKKNRKNWTIQAKKNAKARRSYTMNQVKKMRRLREEGWTYQAIASEYETSKGHMYDIINGRFYFENK